MNTRLLEQIVRNIFENFRVIPSEFVDSDKTKSLITDEFLLKDRLSFDVDGVSKSNRIWGCQMTHGDSEFKIILGDCSQEENIPEFCLIIQITGAPTYAVYLVYNDLVNKEVPSDPMIACSLNKQDWLECNTYLQATFLAGMENLKELGLAWKKCKKYHDQIDMMRSFIKFYEAHYYDGDDSE